MKLPVNLVPFEDWCKVNQCGRFVWKNPMPEENRTCPSCGFEVPDGRYCKFCGKPLHVDEFIKDSLDDNHEDESHTIEPLSDVVVAQLPEFDIIIDGMDEIALRILLSRAELSVIDSELDELIEQIGATRQALLLEHADKGVLTERAQSLKMRLQYCKERREKLLRVTSPLSIEKTLDSLKSEKLKLSKLEQLDSSIDSDVIDEQRKKLVQSIKSLRKELKPKMKKAKSWLKNMKKKLKDLHRDSNRLDARYKIGDISSKSYDSVKYTVSRSIQILECSCIGLEKIISSVKESSS